MQNEKNKKEKFYSFSSLAISIMLIISHAWYLNYQKNNIMDFNYKFAIIRFLTTIIIFSFLFVKCKKNNADSSKKTIYFEKILEYSLYFIPIILFFGIEFLVGNFKYFDWSNLVLNIIIYYAIYLILYLILNDLHLSAYILSILGMILILAQYFILRFRGTPLLPLDFLMVNTAATVASSYKLYIDYSIFVIFLLLILYLYKTRIVKKNIKQKKNKFILFIVVVFFCSFINIKSKINFFELNLFETINNYYKYGFALTLVNEFKNLKIKMPIGYSDKIAKESLNKSQYIVEGSKESEIQPENIIVIMSEAFADLENLGNISIKDGIKITPFIKSLIENNTSGYVSVPTYGGVTANSEYEFLTGNSLHFFPPGYVPYQLNTHKIKSNIINTLKMYGYHCCAMHTYIGKNYNRNVVYPQLGFDEYITDNYGDVEFIRTFPSDVLSYNILIDKIKQTDGKLFSFLITIQNHGGYAIDGYENEVNLCYEQSYPQAEQYLSLLQLTDRQIKDFIEQLSKIDENTMVVFFGDHLPLIEESFYNTIMGKDRGSLSTFEYQKLYETPFFIWKNYENGGAKNKKKNLSLNYFGPYVLSEANIPVDGYNKYLLDLMSKIPIIGQGGIQTSNGDWFNYEDIQENEKQLLDQYEIVQYYTQTKEYRNSLLQNQK
ncbi:LTA synthase family protein [Criibacterium bergeronii]|uniref:LTA synthase family protein n=1 Tax=Criibacterium bergeronii TaxID=1871336 RepID=A0A552VBV1_9FIRM|nr:LTA synthase family protein [Criibacterium bergeronii]TRW27955.1 LTA synthase family protein [Criibacterium bergeronii]